MYICVRNKGQRAAPHESGPTKTDKKMKTTQNAAQQGAKYSKTVMTVLDEVVTLDGSQVFVMMTDNFLSGWGMAADKVAKRVIICENYKQANEIADRLYKGRKINSMRNIKVTEHKPYFAPSKYFVSWEKYAENLFNYR